MAYGLPLRMTTYIKYVTLLFYQTHKTVLAIKKCITNKVNVYFCLVYVFFVCMRAKKYSILPSTQLDKKKPVFVSSHRLLSIPAAFFV